MILLNNRSFKCGACDNYLNCCVAKLNHKLICTLVYTKLCNYVCCYFCCKQSFITCVYFFAGHEKFDVLLEVRAHMYTVSMYMHHIGICRHIDNTIIINSWCMFHWNYISVWYYHISKIH